MKYLLLSILIILLFGTACDKLEISSKQSETFVRNYGVGLEDEGTKVVTTSTGYLIMANIRNPGRGRDICIITTDEYGNTTAPLTTIGDVGDEYGYAIKPTGDGYIIAGSTQSNPNVDKDVYVVKLGTNGSFRWDTTLAFANNNEAYDVYVEDDGELIFTGYTESGEGTQQKDILFIKTPANVNSILHFGKLGIPGAEEVSNSLTHWKDSTYMFAGFRIGNQETRNIYVVSWTGHGTSALDIRIPTEGNSEAQVIINSQTPGRFIVACNNEIAANESEILLLDSDTTMTIQNVVSTRLGERSINSVYSMNRHEGSLYLCGTSSSGDLEIGDILLIKLTSAGTNPVYYYIGDGTSYTGRGFDITDDGGYILTGASYLNEKSMISLYKVNNEGAL